MSIFVMLVVAVLVGLFAVLSLLPEFLSYSDIESIVQIQD